MSDACIISYPRHCIVGVSKNKRKKLQEQDSIKNIGKVSGYLSPLILINNCPVNGNINSLEAPTLTLLTEKIRHTNFIYIDVLFPDAKTMAISGSRGYAGVVLMTLVNRGDLEKFTK